MSNLVYRRYQPGDAHAVSQLFRVVYGDHYVQPDVYLPNMISQHNADGRWTSMLAVDGKRVLGHAALCNDTLADTTELALSVVHPAAQRQSIATNLSRELLRQARFAGVQQCLDQTGHPPSLHATHGAKHWLPQHRIASRLRTVAFRRAATGIHRDRLLCGPRDTRARYLTFSGPRVAAG